MSGELQAAIERRIMTGARYRGVPALMNPMDAWVYSELVHDLRPDVIVEVGNKHGGSLMYLAGLFDDEDDDGYVVGVDISRELYEAPTHYPRVRLVTGDAIAVYPAVAELVAGRSCLVIEDSAHTYQHTLDVLRTYGQLVQVGGYMVCEDGVMKEVAEALDQFASEQDEFEADISREWPVTWNPGGYLRRVK